MSYSNDPVGDALRYEDEREAGADAHQAALIHFENEIAVSFVDFGKLPYVCGASKAMKVRYQPFTEAASDLIADDKLFDLLMVALKTSDCPKVKALKDAMQAEYIRMWADDCAQWGGV